MATKTGKPKITKREKQKKKYRQYVAKSFFECFIWIPIIATVCFLLIHAYAQAGYVGEYSKLYEASGVCTDIRSDYTTRGKRHGTTITLTVDGIEYYLYEPSLTETTYDKIGGFPKLKDACHGKAVHIQYTSGSMRKIASLSSSEAPHLITLQDSAADHRPAFIFVICFFAVIVAVALVCAGVMFWLKVTVHPYYLIKKREKRARQDHVV